MRGLAEKWEVLIVIAVGTFMVVLDTTIVNIALPKIIAVFESSIDQAQLVLTGYMLALAAVMPATAFLSQTYGTKRAYLVTVLLFTIGSMLCGAAWSIESLVAARVLQGLGGGMIQPLGMAMLFRVTPPHQRGGMMGIYALPVMGAPILGPTLGGYLVEYVDWRWVFYMNLPPGILALVLGALLLRETPTRPGLRFDLVGFLLAATCTGSALLGATEATEFGWSDTGVVVKLAISAVTLPLFIWWELRVREPLMNLRLFAIPAFSLGAIVNFVATAAMFGALFLLPLFLQDVRGLGALESGLLLLPQALAMAVSLVLGGRLYDLLGPRPLVVPGLLLLGLATWMLSGLDVNTSDDEIRAILFLRGAAIGMTMMPAITAWLASVPARETQAASALNNVLRQVFGAFSTAIFATILDDRITFHYANMATFVTPSSPGVLSVLARAPQMALEHGLSLAQAKAILIGQIASQVDLAASVRGFDDCFLIAAIACVLGAIPSWFIRRPSSSTAQHGPVEA